MKRTIELALEAQDDDLTERLGGYGVSSLRGTERIGALFDFTLIAVQLSPSAEEAIGGDEILGARLALVFRTEEGVELRRIAGIAAEVDEHVTALTNGDGDAPLLKHPTLKLRIVPSHHQLAMVRTQEVYLDQSIPELIEHKLGLHDLEGASRLHLLASYPKRELVAQHDETDLAFVSRLCEHFGISFFSRCDGERDELVFVDSEDGFPEADAPLLHAELAGYGLRELTVARKLVTRHYGVDDYNYLTPNADLLGMSELESGWMGGAIEYGSHHLDGDEGAKLAAIRAEEARGTQTVLHGTSDAIELAAGHRFTLDQAPAGFGQMLVIAVDHELTQAVGINATEEARYENRFVAVPPGFTYRPPRSTPRPRIDGLLTGVIQAGPDGATGGFARLDAHGRYTVQFHYDAVHVDGTRASHPVRLAQTFTGPDQGMHFPLRPGTEVLLAFVGGDPDRPVIVGAVANPLTRSPVTGQRPNRNRITTGSGITIELSDGR